MWRRGNAIFYGRKVKTFSLHSELFEHDFSRAWDFFVLNTYVTVGITYNK